jgi:hypothetical protein
MGDNPVSTSASTQRKLPIPSSGANTNSAFKGILIKPKRILPAQPDNPKLKRNSQQTNGSEFKADEVINETSSRADFNPSCKSENANKNSSHKVTIPKLLIDVDRLKTHFQLHGKATGRSDSRKKDFNENEIQKNTQNESVRSQTECTNVTSEFLSNENKLYDSVGLTNLKVKEWCSSGDLANMTAKMSADSTTTKSIERSIRSPSPKSNTTWDRSSSGYSSDERADPRSPPPSHSASASVSSKTETELTNDDDVLASNIEDASENQTDIENEEESEELPSQDRDNSDDQTLSAENSASSNSSNSLGTTQTSDNEVLIADSDSTQCVSCEANNNGADKNETTNSCVSLPFDNSVGSKQNAKRSAWTAHSPLPGNGRIQYRKSGSESMISLRHTSRQGMMENNFDGLEVCGKSFPQSASNNVAAKCDSTPQDGANCEASGRQEILSPTSAFVHVPRLGTSIGSELQQNDASGQEMTPRSRLLRNSLPQFRNPRDIKSLGLGPNGK